MNSLRHATFLLIIAAVLWPGEPPRASSSALAGTSWRIVEIRGTPVADAGVVTFEPGRISGRAACNRFFAEIKDEGQRIHIGPIGATKMMCEGRMQPERDLFDALAGVAGVRRDATRVLLVDAQGTTLLALEP